MSISLLMPGATTSSGPVEKVFTVSIAIVLLIIGIAGDRFTLSGYMKGSPKGATAVPRWLGRAVFLPIGMWLLYRAFF